METLTIGSCYIHKTVLTKSLIDGTVVPEAPSARMLRSSSYPWQKASISSLEVATLSLQTASAIITVMVGPLGHQRPSCESTGSLVAMSAVPTKARAERQ